MTTKELEVTDRDMRALVAGVAATRPVEIGCDECLDRVASYVEDQLQALPTREALRLVEEHLELCFDCREEFEALAQAVRGLLGNGAG